MNVIKASSLNHLNANNASPSLLAANSNLQMMSSSSHNQKYANSSSSNKSVKNDDTSQANKNERGVENNKNNKSNKSRVSNNNNDDNDDADNELASFKVSQITYFFKIVLSTIDSYLDLVTVSKGIKKRTILRKV
jgi:hypothetical protein